MILAVAIACDVEPREVDRSPAPDPRVSAPAGGAAQRDVRGRKRRDLQLELERQPGWKLRETAHYFIVTDVGDEPFLQELEARAESIRARIREDFPHPELDPTPVRTAPDVIRVLRDSDAYRAYGAVAGSVGYWDLSNRQIVLYDDKADGGRGETWAVLNGMVFLAYFDQLHGGSAPPWFGLGHSDYYSGARLLDGTYRMLPFEWREGQAQQVLRDGSHPSLQDLLHMDAQAYKGGGRGGRGVEVTYPLGWSFIWFLRQGATRSDTWNPAWDAILPRWLEAWDATHDNDAALEQAFTGVDVQELERAWKAFVLS